MHIPVLYALFVMFAALFRTIRRGLRDPETRGVVYGVLVLLALGTVFYRYVEDLRWVDAFYFTVITLTTIGYGDISPETDAGKLFTVAYSLIGLGALGAFIGLIARQQRERRAERRRVNQPDDSQVSTDESE